MDSLESLASTVYLARQALRDFTPEQFRARPFEGKWNALEVLCHLADMEALWAERIKRVLVEDRPALANADENRYAAVLAYGERDPETELAAIESLRRQMARILERQPASAWERVGVHSTAGELTVNQLVEKVSAHLLHHVEYLIRIRAALRLP